MRYRVTRLEADRDPYRVIVRGVADGGEFITATFRRAEAPLIGQYMEIGIVGTPTPPSPPRPLEKF